MGMSQERLGDALGLTFQQVQKYERGVNRVGASRLFDLSRVLDVPISFFFDDMPEPLAGMHGNYHDTRRRRLRREPGRVRRRRDAEPARDARARPRLLPDQRARRSASGCSTSSSRWGRRRLNLLSAKLRVVEHRMTVPIQRLLSAAAELASPPRRGRRPPPSASRRPVAAAPASAPAAPPVSPAASRVSSRSERRPPRSDRCAARLPTAAASPSARPERVPPRAARSPARLEPGEADHRPGAHQPQAERNPPLSTHRLTRHPAQPARPGCDAAR